MTISDLFFVHQRGTLTGLLLTFGLIGNYFAPVAAGYCATSQGWRWAFWWSAVILGVCLVSLVFFLEETKYIPPANARILVVNSTREERVSVSNEGIMEKEVKQKDFPTGPTDDVRHGSVNEVVTYDARNIDTKRVVQIDHSIPKHSLRQRFAFYTPSSAHGYSWLRHLYQPFLMLYHFPAVLFAAITWAFCLSALSVVAVSQSDLLPLSPYNFSAAGVGLTNVPAAIGSILGTIVGGPLVDWYIVQRSKRNKGIYEPEYRLHLFVVPAAGMVTGIFLYGLTIARVSPHYLASLRMLGCELT